MFAKLELVIVSIAILLSCLARCRFTNFTPLLINANDTIVAVKARRIFFKSSGLQDWVDGDVVLDSATSVEYSDATLDASETLRLPLLLRRGLCLDDFLLRLNWPILMIFVLDYLLQVGRVRSFASNKA